MTVILPGLAASARRLLAQGNAHSRVHTHTHTRSGARRWLLGSSASVRTNVFFSTTTVSAGFYKSTFLSRLVKHKQWEPKTQLWKNIDVKINHRYFLFFLLFFFPLFQKWTFSPSDLQHSSGNWRRVSIGASLGKNSALAASEVREGESFPSRWRPRLSFEELRNSSKREKNRQFIWLGGYFRYSEHV